ncbi:MAG: LEA type 2 family protein [Gemmatimonadaceae bacterium]|nr:LEA type 2 family protein [Gemmatimonadaceae bacterium]
MTSSSRRVAFAAVLITLGAAGCGRMAQSAFQNPVVELKDVVLRGVGLQGGTLDVILDVQNLNDYRIDLSRVTYTVFAESLKVATGEVTKMVTLDNKSRTQVTLPVNYTFREVQQAANILMQRGSVEYTVEGDFTLATPFGSITRPYRSKGRYDTLGR